MERKIAMSEHERKYNLPMTAIAVIGIASIVACALGPSIAAFAKAGSEDGFTLEALDYEPSGWWAVGLDTALGDVAVEEVEAALVAEGFDLVEQVSDGDGGVVGSAVP